MNKRRWIAGLVVLGIVNGAWAQDSAPELPPGLRPDKTEETKPEPELPPGLGTPARESQPALPPGLGGSEEAPDTAQPELPPGLGGDQPAETETDVDIERQPLTIHGFWDARGGVRLFEDSVQSSDPILGESRLQLETNREIASVRFEYAGDFIVDTILDEVDYDLRKLRIIGRLGERIDYSVGRQVLTWGTGDLLFINDLFPKDWQSFLAGRDVEYLKAPSDSVKLSWFGNAFNVDLVYTPEFEPDRFITGERISFYNPMLGRRAGEDDEVRFHAPSDWFEDDEIAVRAYRTFGSTEVALYGYNGYWKSPAGQQMMPARAIFPRLSVYGASARGTVGKGVANAEIGYYDSRDDSDGDDPLIDNGEFRLLLGYEQEIGKEFTGAVQYYLVHMLDYDEYRDTLPSFIEPRDENRHVLTLRLTKLLMEQDLTLSSFVFYSPSDGDGYWRPSAALNVTDDWALTAGGNVFFGEADHTFFGQFQNNSNIYASVRYTF